MTRNRCLIPFIAATVMLAGAAAGQQSRSYLITADVFTQGSGAAIVESSRYAVSVSAAQRSVCSEPVTSAGYMIESGYQAAARTPDGGSPQLSYSEWIAENGLTGPDADPDYDDDGDGFTNFQEYIANTDPTVNDSFLHIVSTEHNGDRTTIAFFSSSVRLYEVWFTTDLSTESDWTRLMGPRYGIDDQDVITHDRQDGFPAGFYRVKVLLPE